MEAVRENCDVGPPSGIHHRLTPVQRTQLMAIVQCDY